ncbi:MAG TPA: hypothetical protein VEP49_04325 [Acidimicrobiia bacterium]|nr:hypothetical protein [Acidimicrobiia bacterium]
MDAPPRSTLVLVLRAILLVAGVVAIAAALVGSFDAEFVFLGVDPWWHVGLGGLIAVVIALGSPFAGRVSTD